MYRFKLAAPNFTLASEACLYCLFRTQSILLTHKGALRNYEMIALSIRLAPSVEVQSILGTKASQVARQQGAGT